MKIIAEYHNSMQSTILMAYNFKTSTSLIWNP